MKDSLYMWKRPEREKFQNVPDFARGRSENGQDAGPAQAGIYKIKCCDRK